MQSDERLIRKIIRQQNREAANLLVERYYKEMYAYAYRQTGNQELAMDLTQEIFIAVLQGLGSYDKKKASFRTWAYRVAANKITNYYRSLAHRMQEREFAYLSQEEKKLYSGYTVEEYERESGRLAEDVAETIAQRDTIQRVMVVVSGFPAEWVHIFQQKCFEEKTFLQIAEDMGVSVNTAKTRFYTMLKRIKKEVAFDE